MGRQGIVKTIRSYAFVLLVHLIKQPAENRTTRFWDLSIRNAVREIKRENKRRKSGGYYLSSEELREVLEEAYINAIDLTSLEVAEGRYEPEELSELVNREELLDRAFTLITGDRIG